jgi:hypothetical protein
LSLLFGPEGRLHAAEAEGRTRLRASWPSMAAAAHSPQPQPSRGFAHG